ncbi:MAG: hypothetical protein R3E02_00825 [Blastomonas sp.]
MSAKLTDYRIAIENYNQAKSEWRIMTARLKKTIHWLEQANDASLFTQQSTTERGPLCADKWPDAQTMAALIERVHTLRNHAKAAYELIPENDRSIVEPRH